MKKLHNILAVTAIALTFTACSSDNDNPANNDGKEYPISLSVGIGFTATSEIDLWRIFPEVVQSVFSANVVAVVFVVSIILNLILPQNMEVEKAEE